MHPAPSRTLAALGLCALLVAGALLASCRAALGPRVPAGVIAPDPEPLPPTGLDPDFDMPGISREELGISREEPGISREEPAAFGIDDDGRDPAGVRGNEPARADDLGRTGATAPAGGGSTPVPPAPPEWDPSRDRIVRRRDVPETAPVSPVAPGSPVAPDLAGPVGPAVPAEPTRPVATPITPASTADLGLPPGGVGATDPAPLRAPPSGEEDPWLAGSAGAGAPPAATERPAGQRPAPGAPGAPAPGPRETPAATALPVAPVAPLTPPSAARPPEPAPGPGPDNPPGEDDPWLAGAAPGTPVRPAPQQPVPAPAGDDPWLAGATPGAPRPPAVSTPAAGPGPVARPRAAPAPAAAAPDDPWSSAPGAPPAGVPSTPTVPGVSPPTSAVPVAPTRPRAPGEGAIGYVGASREQQAMEHLTRLLDQPGDPKVAGYPAAILPHGDPGMALLPGPHPAVVLFVDDASRESDLQAARALPVLARYADQLTFVVVERGPDAKPSRGGDALAERYFREVPTTAVLDGDRRVVLLRTGRIDGADLEEGIRRALKASGATTDATAPTPGTPDPWASAPGTTGSGAQDVQPEAGLRTSTPDAPARTDGDPARTDPVFSTPDGPMATQPQPATERAPDVVFTPPPGYGAEAHIARLKAEAGTRALPGYPSEMLRRAEPGVVTQPGHRPVVLLFYDDSSKASDLQAAEFLPVLMRRQDQVDCVLIDISTGARWSEDEKRVVRTYYNYVVPTTVVLTDRRAPVKFWYMRVDAKDLDRAIDQALSRK